MTQPDPAPAPNLPGPYAGPPVQQPHSWNGYGQPGPSSYGPVPVPLNGPPPQYPPAYPQQVVGVAPKSAGLAVLLSFLWLGAGHLYANRIGAGIALMVYEAFLALLSFSIVGLVISVPLWFISVIVVMILAANAANDFNRRNGIVVR
jgi:TM2 domain-containing membrane protein YozV